MTTDARGLTTLPPWLPPGVLAVLVAVLALVVIAGHGVPTYGVETDLLGDLVPAARALRAGHATADNFQFKGPGYPLLLAGAGALTGGDDWLAARLLGVVAAGAGAWFAFRIAAWFLGAAAGLFVMLALFANPVWLRAAVEAGTDMPAFALSMAATWLALSAGGRRRVWLLAGLVAALATLTRYSAVARLPAALVVVALLREASWRTRLGHAAAYVAGFVVPLVAWRLASQAMFGGPAPNHNYLNVAFELYGRGMSWDQFWTNAAGRFHSYADVLRFDPVRAARGIGTNLALRWWRDVRELVPVWLGIPAVLGMLLVWPRRRGALAIAAQYAFGYAVLATVFYAQRFFLDLVPFYLMGVAALPGALGRPEPAREPAPATKRGAKRVPPPRRARAIAIPAWLPWAVGAGLVVASAVPAVNGIRTLLGHAPYEAREAGLALRRLAPAGGRVLARKPHVAYFANMDYDAIPLQLTLSGLMRFADERHADWLLYSGYEATARSQYLLLADSAVTLPGLVPVARRWDSPEHFYVLYRFTHERLDTVAFATALLQQTITFARRNANDAKVQAYAGGLLFDFGYLREAALVLRHAGTLDPSDQPAAEMSALASYAAGEVGPAVAECERAIALGHAGAPVHMAYGVLLAAASRWPEAVASFRTATGLSPTDARAWLELGIALLASGAAADGRAALDRATVVDPAVAPIRASVLAAFARDVPARGAVAMLRVIQDAVVLVLPTEELVAGWPS